MSKIKQIIEQIRNELKDKCLVDVVDLTMLLDKIPFPVALPTTTTKRINELLSELDDRG